MNNKTTKNKNYTNGPNNIIAIQIKLARKENIKANPHNVNCHFNLTEEASFSSNDRKSTLSKAYTGRKDILMFLEPSLVSLPSTISQLPAKDLASLALSAAVLYKNATEKLICLSTMKAFLSSTRFNFELKEL